jgi:hypothetical protein
MPTLLKIKKFIENDVWKINFTLDTTTLPESDKELIRKFGEPQIDIGGTYLSGTPNQYVLPTKYIRVRSDLPFTQEFDAKSHIDFLTTPAIAKASTQARALAFQTYFINAFTAAFVALRNSRDTFTGEYIANI